MVQEVSRSYAYPKEPADLASFFLDQVEQHAISRRSKSIAPIVLLCSETKQRCIDGRPFFKHEEGKRMLVSFSKAMASDMKAIASVFISETWLSMLSGKAAQKALEGSFMLPSEDPNRIEALICVAEYRGKAAELKQSRIVRNSQGEIVCFKPFLMQGASSVTGFFTGILG